MREFSVPAEFTIGEGESAVDSVYSHESLRPELVVFRIPGAGGWADVTAGDFAASVRATAKGLIDAGIAPGDRVALISGTRYEWSLVDFAIWSAGAITVPIYETSSPEQIHWVLEDSGAAAAIVETPAMAAVVADLAVPAAARVWSIAPTDGSEGAIAALSAAGAAIADREVIDRVAALRSADPATFVYTSGTTGRPKGCVLTHANLIAESRGIRATSFGNLLAEGKSTLMFLPMAHVLARAVAIACFDAGATVGHTSDTSNLPAAFGAFTPHFILSVPRVFEKVFNAARANAASSGREKIFDAAVETAVEWSRKQDDGGPGLILKAKHWVFDHLVYSKLRTVLGGRCELAISGGAPLGARLAHFYRGIGMTVFEGYGLTETTAAVSVNMPGSQRIGSVGKPLPGNGVRISAEGEILLSGAVLFAGYWRNEAATAEAIEDGWFHTGDLGNVDSDGYISITGRKKEIIVTAGGKNVAPAGLEDSLRAHALISQAMVVGDQKPFIGALITIDAEAFAGWKSRHGKDAGATVEDLATDSALIAEIDSAVAEANTHVSHAEGIRKYRILPVDFTEATGELTPTMKVKRNVVSSTFATDIDAIYAR